MPRPNFIGNKYVEVTIQPNIGLDASARQSVIGILNLLLADETVLSIKTQGLETQPDGKRSPDLRPLYNEQYKQINDIVSEITERVNILGGSRLGTPEELIDTARLDGSLDVIPGIMSLLADHEAIIRFVREDAQKCSELYEDQGTFALLVSVMCHHEKMAWILRSNITTGQLKQEN